MPLNVSLLTLVDELDKRETYFDLNNEEEYL